MNANERSTSVSSDKTPVSIQTVSVSDDTADPKIKERVDRYLRGKQARRDQAIGDLEFCRLEKRPPPKELVERIKSLPNAPKRRRLEIPELENWPPGMSPIMTESALPLVAALFGIRPSSVYRFLKAVYFEALRPVDPTGISPSTAKVAHIAKASGVDRKLVRCWRNNPEYNKEVTLVRSAVKIVADNRKNAPETSGDL
jgi:hypothetical protein